MSTADEHVMIVDRENQPVGTASRGVMRRFDLPHRATYILVFNSAGEVFLHRRTFTKDIYPGYWCPAVGGVVGAGESYEEAAARELQEELGIDAPLTALFDFYHENQGNKVWGRAFSCVHDGPFRLQAEEIESGSFCPVAEVLVMAEEQPFTPDGFYALKRHLDNMRANER